MDVEVPMGHTVVDVYRFPSSTTVAMIGVVRF